MSFFSIMFDDLACNPYLALIVFRIFCNFFFALPQAMISGGLNISALADYSLTSLSPEDFEVQHLSDPPLTDHLTAANETMSRVFLLGPQQEYR